MRVRVASVLAVLVLAAPPLVAGQDSPAPLLIAAFAPDLPGADGDDAIAIANPGAVDVLLDGWGLRDGEGELSWPTGAVLPARTTVVVAVNASAWSEAARAVPDYAVFGVSGHGAMTSTGSFLLSRTGDEIQLLHGETVVDAVVYGSADASLGWHGQAVDLVGSPFLRWYPRGVDEDGAWSDTDSADDWTAAKPAFVGASDHPRLRVSTTASILAYASPDSSRTSVRAFLQSANQSLRLNVYELADGQILADLEAAARRGVDVRVLLDEQPVGMTPLERSWRDGMIARLSESGAAVRYAVHERIAYNHAKYAVADGRLVMVQTENLVATGIPWDATQGNRGWGVIVEDESLATYMAGVFDADWTLDPWGARAWTPPDPPAPPPNLFEADLRGRPAFAALWISGAANITPVVAPDHVLERGDPVLAAIESASTSLRVVQLQLPPQWKDRTGRTMENQYLEALMDAAERGVQVRVLVDTHFVDADDDTLDNLDTLALSGASAGRFQVREFGHDRPGVLHAKGMVVDDSLVLVGSMNWNLNSPARNREVSLLVESAGVASYFSDVFDADWDDEAGPLGLSATGPVAFIATVITLALLLGASRIRRPM